MNSTSVKMFSGREIDLENPQPDQIDICDLARGMAMTARFAGQTYCPYSVAQHSVHAAELAPDRFRFQVLMHDAHEGIIGDQSRGLKVVVPELFPVANRLDAVIFKKFGVRMTDEAAAAVRKFDNKMLSTEALHLKPDGIEVVKQWGLSSPAFLSLVPWDWHTSYCLFLSAFNRLKPANIPAVEFYSGGEM